MNINEFKDLIDDICIPGIAESWDNSGYQVKINSESVSKVLVALEITEKVIEEAIAKDVDVIVTHHPLIFDPIKSVCEDSVIGGYIVKLIKNGISVISTHTNFDKMEDGNNDYIGKLLGIKNMRFMGDDEGYSRMGSFDKPLSLREAAHLVAEKFDIDESFFHLIGNPDKMISKLAWCSGSGSEFITLAASKGCDLFITGDVKYHTAQTASELGICVIDAGHFGTEIIFVENMASQIENYAKKEKIELEVIRSEVDINPFTRV